MQIRDARDTRGQRANRRGRAATLPVEVHAKAAKAFQGERKVDGVAVTIAIAQAGRHDRRHRTLDVLAAEGVTPKSRDMTFDAGQRRETGNEEQVAAVLFADLAKPVREVRCV